MRLKVPARDQIAPDTPLRLGIAAALAFPDGSMTASGLRREAAKGRLAIERVAGKDYTTLAAIAEMRELCRKSTRGHDLCCAQRAEKSAAVLPTNPCGLSGTVNTGAALAAALTIADELSKRSPSISPKNALRRRRKATVIPVKSP